jgi:hypothetical protein
MGHPKDAARDPMGREGRRGRQQGNKNHNLAKSRVGVWQA